MGESERPFDGTEPTSMRYLTTAPVRFDADMAYCAKQSHYDSVPVRPDTYVSQCLKSTPLSGPPEPPGSHEQPEPPGLLPQELLEPPEP
jgi:hypothetical protein